MKKILLYAVVAAAFGLVIMLVPLITLAEVATENRYLSPLVGSLADTAEFNRVQKTQDYSSVDVSIFAISFVIAIAVYAVSKRKMPREGQMWIKPY